MSVDPFTFLALAAAAALGIWWRVRLRRTFRRSSLTLKATSATHPVAPPPPIDPVRALTQAKEKLEVAERLLRKTFAVGIWVKGDGCDDNRERRQCLRDAASALADALDAFMVFKGAVDVSDYMSAIEVEIRRLIGEVATIRETVTDIMADNLAFDSAIWTLYDNVARVLAQIARLEVDHDAEASSG